MTGYKSAYGQAQKLAFRKPISGDRTENAPFEISPVIGVVVQFVSGLPSSIANDLVCANQVLDDLFKAMIARIASR